MYAITGVTGKVGGALARALLAEASQPNLPTQRTLMEQAGVVRRSCTADTISGWRL
jgi:uncharacterized protein YbjT (DUF2867 family)